MKRVLQLVAGRLTPVVVAFVIGTLCVSMSAYGQLKATFNSSTQSVSTPPGTGIPQPAQAPKEPSCTSETSAPGNAQHGAHSVALSWKASTSLGVLGYNVYRRIETSDKFTKINDKPVPTTDCVDYSVHNGQKYYYYVVTADHPGVPESAHSNIAPAKIPSQ